MTRFQVPKVIFVPSPELLRRIILMAAKIVKEDDPIGRKPSTLKIATKN
jgi:hypothetical protein